jgi:hypothetical protein
MAGARGGSLLEVRVAVRQLFWPLSHRERGWGEGRQSGMAGARGNPLLVLRSFKAKALVDDIQAFGRAVLKCSGA